MCTSEFDYAPLSRNTLCMLIFFSFRIFGGEFKVSIFRFTGCEKALQFLNGAAELCQFLAVAQSDFKQIYLASNFLAFKFVPIEEFIFIQVILSQQNYTDFIMKM